MIGAAGTAPVLVGGGGCGARAVGRWPRWQPTASTATPSTSRRHAVCGIRGLVATPPGIPQPGWESLSTVYRYRLLFFQVLRHLRQVLRRFAQQLRHLQPGLGPYLLFHKFDEILEFLIYESSCLFKIHSLLHFGSFASLRMTRHSGPAEWKQQSEEFLVRVGALLALLPATSCEWYPNWD